MTPRNRHATTASSIQEKRPQHITTGEDDPNHTSLLIEAIERFTPTTAQAEEGRMLLVRTMGEVEAFAPNRVAIDSRSAVELIGTKRGFRVFVLDHSGLHIFRPLSAVEGILLRQPKHSVR